MLFAMAVLAGVLAGVSVEPYRYHVQVAYVDEIGNTGRYEIRTREFECREIKVSITAVTTPEDVRFPHMPRRMIRGSVFLKMEDVHWTHEGQVHWSDVYSYDAEGEFLLTVTDRQEKRSIWPIKPPDP